MFPPLTNLQLDKFFDRDKGFNGIYPKDIMPRNLKPNKFYIFNLDDADGGGTHWTCLYCRKKRIDYFDSFGVRPPVNIMNLIEKANRPSFFNAFQIQDIDSALCGYYCIFFIEQMKNKRSMVDIVFDFEDDTLDNDARLENHFISNNLLAKLKHQ